MRQNNISSSLKNNKTLIIHVDCSKPYPSENYFEIGESKIIHSPIGSYREAAKQPLSRFGYRFRLNNPEMSHLFEVHYPDDKRRFMCINDGTSYDLTTGVVCGGVNKPSNTMKTIKNYFYTRWTDESIVFSSWGKDEPAAVSEFYIYQLDSLPKADLPQECFNPAARSFGLQYEDPCNVGSSEGAKEHGVWLKHYIEYMKFTGSMTLLRLGRLMENMNNDASAIREGADTYNNILYDGSVQDSTNDWTMDYNPSSYEDMINALEKADLNRGENFEFARLSGRLYLPRKKFHTLEKENDVAAVRWLADNGVTWLYAINREPYPITVNVEGSDKTIVFELEPFLLKTEKLDAGFKSRDYRTTLPADVPNLYQTEQEALMFLLNRAKSDGISIPGSAVAEKLLSNCL